MWTSPFPPLAPDDRTIPELISGHPSDNAALVDGASGVAMAYGELEERIAGMTLAGVVAVWAANSPEWAIAALGAMAAGAAVTAIPPGVTEREAAVQLTDAGARVLMRDPPHAEALRGTRVPDPGLVLLPYSSGTTGHPKGVMLTHANLVAAARQVGAGLGLGEGDKRLADVRVAERIPRTPAGKIMRRKLELQS
jgi:4-coumarate--CoA ligase